MKAFVVDGGCYISEWLFGCSGGDSCREFCIVVPEFNLAIYPNGEYEIHKIVFRIADHRLGSEEKWESDPRAKAIDFPLELLLDIMAKIRAEEAMGNAHRFLAETFTSAVREDWSKRR